MEGVMRAIRRVQLPNPPKKRHDMQWSGISNYRSDTQSKGKTGLYIRRRTQEKKDMSARGI